MSADTTEQISSYLIEQDRRSTREMCGAHTAAIKSLDLAEEDRKKEIDAQQKEIGQLFTLLRESTANVNSLSASIATMKAVFEEDHKRTEILWNKCQQEAGKAENQSLLRSWEQIIIACTLGAAVSWIVAHWPGMASHIK